MQKPHWLGGAIAICTFAFCVSSLSAQKMDATVLYRQNSDNNYAALVPDRAGVLPQGTVDCAAEVANEACSTAPAQTGVNPPLNVTGTTISLLLPDGKVAVVNCVNKYSPKGDYIVHRSCAMPLVEHVEADFNGQRAKLTWLVGPDGRKMESETYKVVALLDRH
jgi:type 1 fimbria pilin